ncbi:MAG: isochorismatase family cysteine hydrolase [Chloroflexota bacterium]
MIKTLEEKVDPRDTALLVVDVQNDFCHSDGISGKRGFTNLSYRQKMVPRLIKLISQARRAEVPIIFIRMATDPWTLSEVQQEQLLRRGLSLDSIPAQEGTWGADFYRVRPEADDYIVTKHRYSAFIDTDLDLILRSRGVKTVIMTGVATNVCVESTARDASMKDYFVVFVRNCAASFNLRDHNATLRTMDTLFGTVVSYQEVVAAWRR